MSSIASGISQTTPPSLTPEQAAGVANLIRQEFPGGIPEGATDLQVLQGAGEVFDNLQPVMASAMGAIQNAEQATPSLLDRDPLEVAGGLAKRGASFVRGLFGEEAGGAEPETQQPDALPGPLSLPPETRGTPQDTTLSPAAEQAQAMLQNRAALSPTPVQIKSSGELDAVAGTTRRSAEQLASDIDSGELLNRLKKTLPRGQRLDEKATLDNAKQLLFEMQAGTQQITEAAEGTRQDEIQRADERVAGAERDVQITRQSAEATVQAGQQTGEAVKAIGESNRKHLMAIIQRKSLDVRPSRRREFVETAMRQINEQPQVGAALPPLTTADKLQNAAESAAQGAAGIFMSIPESLQILQERGALPGDPESTSALIETMDSTLRELYPQNPRLAESLLTTKLPSGVGSGLAFLFTAAAGGIGGEAAATASQMTRGLAATSRLLPRALATPQGVGELGALLAGGALGGAANGVEAHKEALRSGLDEDAAFTVFLLNSGVGLTEVIPIAGAMNRFAPGLRQGMQRAAISAMQGAGEEIIQENFQTFAQKQTIKTIGGLEEMEHPSLIDLESTVVGGTVGLLFSGVSAISSEMANAGLQKEAEAFQMAMTVDLMNQEMQAEAAIVEAEAAQEQPEAVLEEVATEAPETPLEAEQVSPPQTVALEAQGAEVVEAVVLEGVGPATEAPEAVGGEAVIEDVEVIKGARAPLETDESTIEESTEVDEGEGLPFDPLPQTEEGPGGIMGDPSPSKLSFDPATGVAPAPKKVKGAKPVEPKTVPTLENSTSFVSDNNPLETKRGSFKRGLKDRPKRITQDIARARARRGVKESKRVDNVFSVISDVARRFNIGRPGTARSRTLERMARGFYRPGPESIRLKRGSMVSTMLHEVGHHTHKILFPQNVKRLNAKLKASDFPKEWRSELVLLGRDLYVSKRPNSGYTAEGWAEFIRLVVTNPAHLKKRAPNVYQSAVKTLVTDHPGTWQILTDARIRLINAATLAGKNPIGHFVAHNQRAPAFSTRNAYDDFRSRMFDRMQRLTTMKTDLGLEDVPAHLDPYIGALRVNGKISGDMQVIMERGAFAPGDPARKRTGPGLVEILEPVKLQLEEWQDYMVSRRVLEKRAQGFDVFPADPRDPSAVASDAALREFIRAAEKLHPEWGDYFRKRGDKQSIGQDEKGVEQFESTEDPDTVAAQFQAFNNWLIGEYAVFYNLISSDSASLIIERNLEYITFRHKKTEDALQRRVGTHPGGGGFTGQSSGISRFRPGKGEQIFPPLESFLSSMQGIVSRAQLNRVALQVVSVFEKDIPGAGRWLDKVDRPMVAQTITGQEFSQEVMDQLGISIDKSGLAVLPPYLENMSDEDFGIFITAMEGLSGATFWKPGNQTDRDAREITTLQKGKPVFYEVKDDRLFDLLEGLDNPYTAGLLMKMLSIPSRVLRAGATQLNPSFFIPNFMRDGMQMLAMTETDLSKVDQQTRLRLTAMKQAFTGGGYADLFVASGADMSGLFGEHFDPKKQQFKLDKMFEQPFALGALKGNTAKAIMADAIKLGPVARMNGSFEQSVRLGEFAVTLEQARAAGKGEAESIAQAGQAAADVTLDFQRGGTWTKQINQVVPFFNAAMLGADKLGRFIKKNPVKAFARIFATIIAPSMLTMLLNWDNDDYWSKPKWTRDRYWYIPTGKTDDDRHTYIKIPKPYGLGVFAVATERSYAAMLGVNPESGKLEGDPRAFEGVASAMFDELRPSMSIAGVLPLLEVMAGEQGYSYFREHEIVSSGDKDLPLHMQGASRSSELARILGRWMDYPPAKIDYLIQGYTGGLGKDLVQVGVDPFIRIVDPEAKKGEPIKFEDWMIVRRFVDGATRNGHESISRFYDDLDELTRIDKGRKALESEPKQLNEYESQHDGELGMMPIYSKAQSAISKQFKAIRIAYKQRDHMDADDLDRTVNEAYDSIIEITREVHALRPKK